MADQIDSIIRLRRGPDSERRQITFDQGEIVFSNDTRHTFIGDGRHEGGSLVGNLNYIGSTPSPSAVFGDFYYNPLTNLLYMLSSDAGPDNISNYALITPRGDGKTIEYVNGQYRVIFGTHNPEYVRLIGDTMVGPLIMDGNSNFINVGRIKSNSNYLIIEKPVTITLKNYNEVVITLDANATINNIPVLDLSASNNFYVNLYNNIDGFRIKNCPSNGASFTVVFGHKADNLTINWRLSTDQSNTYIIPKWQMGRLPMVSKNDGCEDAVAFVYMSNKWYGFIAATNMLEPYPSTIS
jgi:hypothetical protein